MLRELERREPSPQLRRHVSGAHEPLTDQHRVGARLDHAPHVGGREEAALADHHRAGRDARQQRQRRVDARLEGAEVAVVDADDPAAHGERRLQLGRGVALDERGEAKRPGRGGKVAQQRRLEDGDDEQHGVGAGSPRLPQLILVDGEVLAQQRHVDGRPHAPQHVEASLEILRVGEDRDRVGAVAGVRGGEPDRIEIGGEHAAGR